MSEHHKPVFLWCVPRSASTAFERAFHERKDVKTMHEPFSLAYYYGPERTSPRFKDKPPQEDQTYGRIARRILQTAQSNRVFVKDMAYHYEGRAANDDLLHSIHSTFLIRHPAAALNSLYKVVPDFTLEETGYPALQRLFEKTGKLTGKTPLLMEAQDVCAAPAAYMRLFCRNAELGFDENALSWQSGRVREQEIWEDFHTRVWQSTGITPLPPPPAQDKLPSYVHEMTEKIMPLYENLCKNKAAP